MSTEKTQWWHKPLDKLSDEEWEALCDGCGLCCLNKMEDIDTGEVYFSRVACSLLNVETAQCGDYHCRQLKVDDCIDLRDLSRDDFGWLPPSCAYRLRHEGKALPSWHYLVCGDKERVHQCGRSVSHFALRQSDGHEIDEHLLLRLEDILGDAK